MLTPAGLVIGLVLASPALWDVAQGEMSLGAGLLRLLAAYVLVAVGTVILRRVTAPQPVRVPVAQDAPRRRRGDDGPAD